jgi:hypothetical protein
MTLICLGNHWQRNLFGICLTKTLMEKNLDTEVHFHGYYLGLDKVIEKKLAKCLKPIEGVGFGFP